LLALSPLRVWPPVVACVIALQVSQLYDSDTIHSERSFFAAHTVTRDDTGFTKLQHGTTTHGMESRAEGLAGAPLSYYHREGPVGQMLAALGATSGQRYAMIGLGAGALAAYCNPGISCDIFEIDPVVVKLARQHFTYLSGCGERCAVEIGDGRLLLAAKPPQTYDIIFLDAYSSDAIPLHLITAEAFNLYKARLKKNGILLLHISNRYINLLVPITALIRHTKLKGYHQRFDATPDQEKRGAHTSHWVIMTDPATPLDPLISSGRWQVIEENPDAPLWTDDASNLLPALTAKRTTDTAPR
jgi:protein-L-isoaspartate O-methyltransferase